MAGREKVTYNGSIFKDQEDYINESVLDKGTNKATELRRLLDLGIRYDRGEIREQYLLGKGGENHRG
jgi:hypothetical protein